MAFLQLGNKDFHSVLFLFFSLERSLSLVLLNPLFEFLFLPFLDLLFLQSFLKFTVVVLFQFGSSLMPLHLFHLHLFLLHVVQFLSSGWHVHLVLPSFLSSSVLDLLNKILGLLCSWVVDAEVVRVNCCLHLPGPVFDSAFDVDLVEILLQGANFVLDHSLFNFDHAVGVGSFHIFKLIFVLRNPLNNIISTLLKAGAPRFLISFWTIDWAPLIVSYISYTTSKNTSLIYRFCPDF